MPTTWLVAPAGDAVRMDAAAGAGADAVVANLTSVGTDDAMAARAELDGWLKRRPDGVQTWVQVAIGDDLEDDLQVVLRHRVDGICVLGASAAAPLAEIARLIGSRPLAMVPVIGSAMGMLNSSYLAVVDKVSRLGLDEAALVADLGMDPSADEHELASLRGHLVVVSTAFGLEPPIGGPPSHSADDDAVRESTERLRRLGYGGRAVVDPSHVAIVHDVFA